MDIKILAMNLRAVRRYFPPLIIFALGGCSALRPHTPPPVNAEPQVQVPGIPNVRVWGDEFSTVFQQDTIDSIRQEEQSGLFKDGDTVSILAISGGEGMVPSGPACYAAGLPPATGQTSRW